MIKLNLDAFARRAVPWRCTDTHVSPSRSPPGGHTTEAACSWSIRRGTLPPRPRRLVTEDARLDTSAVGELLACGDVARREEGDVRQRLVAVLGQHAARGHVGLVARAVDEAGGVARVEQRQSAVADTYGTEGYDEEETRRRGTATRPRS